MSLREDWTLDELQDEAEELRTRINRFRKSSSECAPQFFRQIGNAFMNAVAKIEDARLVKNVSPAAIGKTAPTNRNDRIPPRMMASR